MANTRNIPDEPVEIDVTTLTEAEIDADPVKEWKARLVRALLERHLKYRAGCRDELMSQKSPEYHPGIYTVYGPVEPNSHQYSNMLIQLSSRQNGKLICRSKTNSPDTPCFNVVTNELLGEGFFGGVVRCGTLKLTQHGVVYDAVTHPRVIKCTDYTKKTVSRNKHENESQLSTRANPHAKPVYIDRNGWAHFVADEFKGITLDKYIKDNYFNVINPGFVIKVIRNLIVQLQYLHDCKIQHNDLKPDNVLINEYGDVKIIDFGQAFDLANPVPHSHIAGNGLCAAPEYFLHHTGMIDKLPDYRSDIYALGVCIALFLGGEGREKWSKVNPLIVKSSDTMKIFADFYLKNQHEPRVYTQLFHNIPFDYQEQISFVLLLFGGMMLFDVDQRFTLPQALDLINDIEYSYKKRIGVAEAYTTANCLKAELNRIAQSSIAKVSHDSKDIVEIRNQIRLAVEQLGNDPKVVSEFIDTLDVAAFRGLTTKEAILACTDDILSTFETNVSELLKAYWELKYEYLLLESSKLKYVSLKNDVEFQLKYVNRMIAKVMEKTPKRQTTLDMLAKFNERCAYNKTIRDRKIINLTQNELRDHVRILMSCAKVDETNQLEQLKNRVRTAVEEYMLSTLENKNMQKDGKADGRRAASKGRIDNMQHLLAAVNSADNIKELHDNVSAAADNIKYRHFLFFGGSKLRKNIKSALAATPKSLIQ